MLALALSGAAASVEASCNSADVCRDLASTLWGGSTQDGILVSWSSSSEDAAIDIYRIRRYDCPDPAQCSYIVADVPAVGGCGVSQLYSFVDNPPEPVAAWKYTVEVWRTNGTRACALDTMSP